MLATLPALPSQAFASPRLPTSGPASRAASEAAASPAGAVGACGRRLALAAALPVAALYAGARRRRRRGRAARAAAGGGSGGEVFLGVDFGTSGCRAACLDSEGRLAAEASVQYGLGAGLEDWRSALHQVIQGIPQRGAAAAVCIDGTSATALLCDSRGTPITGPLMYDHACSAPAVERCRTMVPTASHVAAAPTSTLAKVWEWLLDGNAPQGAKLAHQADWLASLLHGGTPATDYHNALKLGYDTEALRWPEWLLSESRVAELLPERVATPGETVGEVSAEAASWLGLPQGCRVAAGTTDSIAAFLAAGTTEVGEAVTSLGTTLAIKLRSRTRVEDASSGVYSHRLGGGQWLVGGASNSGGAVLRQLFGDEAVARLTKEIDPEAPSGLDYYPLPAVGERFPICDAAMQPRLEPRPEGDAQFLHGVLEGIARIEALGYARLRELGAGSVSLVATAGGGAKNAAWRRIRERLIGVPVKSAEWTEASCGTAMLAQQGPLLLG